MAAHPDGGESNPRRRRAPAVLAIVMVVLAAIGVVLAAVTREPIDDNYVIATATGGIAFSILAGLVGSKRPDNRIWVVYAVIGSSLAIGVFSQSYAYYALMGGHALPFAPLMSWIPPWSYVPALVSLFTFALLLFPTGRLPSPRWSPVAWASAAVIVCKTVPFAIASWPYRGLPLVDPNYPEPDTRALHVAGAIDTVGTLLLLPAAILSIAAVVVRYRRAKADEREQMKWLVFALIIVAVSLAKGFLTTGFGDVVEAIDYAVIAIAVGVAILKYHLWDIDVVINKTLVFGGLAVFITAVYVAVVVGLGALLGSSGQPNLGLSIAATAVVAIAFAPARQRVQRWANRVVYGKRATPYEALSGLAERMSKAYAGDEALAEMARLAGQATGATGATVWLSVGGSMVPRGSWPDARIVPTDGLASTVVPVTQGGEVLGSIALDRPEGQPLKPEESRLLDSLAAQAGLALRNVGLIEDLRASRVRLIEAQDDERRRLERNIHDGAQQRLVALAVRFNMTQRLLPPDDGLDRAAVEDLAEQTKAALEDLRNLARGIYPPLLADHGLVDALEAQAARSPVPTEVFAAGVRRYPQATESAIYFSCLEALQNVSKYAHARRVLIRLQGGDDEIAFEVHDDGVGFDPATTPRGSGLTNIADRLAALDGDLEVRSAPGQGVTVAGHLPTANRTLEAVAT